MERILRKWTDWLNKYFDFGSYGGQPLNEKGALAILLLIVIVLVPLLIFLEMSGPEQLPGT